jgi:hypothetical protein
VFMFVCFPWHFSICITKYFFFKSFGSLFVRKNLLHYETGFGVHRSTQLGHIPFFITISVGWPKYRPGFWKQFYRAS